MSTDISVSDGGFDVVCFSHLRWDFVYQRPQHLMSRFARHGRLFFIEEPKETDGDAYMDVSDRGSNVFVCVPHLPQGTANIENPAIQGLVSRLIAEQQVGRSIAWFYTPMMLDWGSGLSPVATVYDCMDELSAFRGAPPELIDRERRLFEQADLVFTGGQSLYEAKKSQHQSVHAFPSSIDKPHFMQARSITAEIDDQVNIPHPRIGFVGVIDERSDIPLLDQVTRARPDWNSIMVGPVVKIDEASLPRHANITYLGQRTYEELPGILAGWDVAMMPFALNESTKFISPTKTPEYLAAGLPVVSTPITDVVSPYGDLGLVEIATTADEFVQAIEKCLASDPENRRPPADEFLKTISWDITFESMYGLIRDVVASGGGASSVEATA